MYLLSMKTAMITSEISHKLLGESSSNEVRFRSFFFFLCTVLFFFSLFLPSISLILWFLDFNIAFLTHKQIYTRSVSSKLVPAHPTTRALELGNKTHPQVQFIEEKFGYSCCFLGRNWLPTFHQSPTGKACNLDFVLFLNYTML